VIFYHHYYLQCHHVAGFVVVVVAAVVVVYYNVPFHGHTHVRVLRVVPKDLGMVGVDNESGPLVVDTVYFSLFS